MSGPQTRPKTNRVLERRTDRGRPEPLGHNQFVARQQHSTNFRAPSAGADQA